MWPSPVGSVSAACASKVSSWAWMSRRCTTMTNPIPALPEMTSFYRLSSKRQANLRQLVQEAQANGIKVAIWITPLHPVTEQYLTTHTQYAALLDATRRSLTDMSKTFGIPTYDFSMLGHDKGVDTGWYDCA